MSARPPPQDDDGEPDVVEFGIAALAARLEDADVTYPADRREVVRRLGDPQVPYDASGNAVSLSTVFEEVEAERFDSERELLNALHPAFESYRSGASTGLIDSIRRLVPF